MLYTSIYSALRVAAHSTVSPLCSDGDGYPGTVPVRTSVQSFCAGFAAAKKQTSCASWQQKGRPGVLRGIKNPLRESQRPVSSKGAEAA